MVPLLGSGNALTRVPLICAATALLWKAFWRPGAFWARGASQARGLFWDFLKNFALAGGFLLLAFGLHAGDASGFVADPLGSSHPYTSRTP